MQKLKIITSTTRPNRIGISLAKWIEKFASENSQFEVELLDLKEIDLPLMNEPNHPILGKYTFDHTLKWSAKIDEADAFIIVLAEYNYGYPAPIKNAIDYLHKEWKYKPVGFLSYGGISAGLRSTQMLKQVVTTLNMMPIAQQINVSFAGQKVDENGVFIVDDRIIKSAENMLQELYKWSSTMQKMREK